MTNKILGKLIEVIEKESPRSILIQFPDGLKPKARFIVDSLKERYPNLEIYIWAGSNYGACDIPNVDVDLIVNIGHAELL